MIWIALITSLIATATALLALREARAARVAADRAAGQLISTAPTFDDGIPWPLDPIGPTAQPQLLADAVADGDNLSGACHTVIRALDTGGDPPTAGDYARIQRCSELFIGSVGRLRAPHDADLVRGLTDELVTMHHSLVTEVKQHQDARYPFVGAKDTSVATLILHRFDAELARLRTYAQTGRVPEPDLPPVDYETVRFVPRNETPGPLES